MCLLPAGRSLGDTSARPHKQPRVAEYSDDEEEEEEASTSYMQWPDTSSLRASGSRSKVFVDTRGAPIPFYVQQGSSFRKQCLGLIKTNGGIIVSEIARATYVVIFPTIEHAFARLQEAITHGKYVVKTAFVRDSVKAGKLLDPTARAYSFEGVEIRDARGHAVRVDIDEMQNAADSKKKKSARKATKAGLPIVVCDSYS